MDLPSVVGAPWLAEQLLQEDIIVIDCRFRLDNPHWGRQQYDRAHIPRAFYLDLNRDLSDPPSDRAGRHPLPTPDSLGAKLAALGIIQGKTRVIAYDDARFAFAARLWWLLRYFGHNRVALLDGGWPAWVAGGYGVSEALPPAKAAGRFAAVPRQDWIVKREALLNFPPGTLLVDARDPRRYRGEWEPIDPHRGHIPGAVNLYWQQVSDEQGYLRSPQELAQLWADYQEAEDIWVYCGSGITACVDLFSLHLLGRNAKLYPGGWSQWCSYF
ncbi:MAG: sulfurtransferase [Chloroflexaceae bacterium]|nr:sulfurtransferase [Chloroflexaceae bacterium]